MIRKLKIKFVAINMAFISIVLIIIFISVYISTNNRIVHDSNDFMRRIVERSDYEKFPKREIGGMKRDDFMPPFTSFFVELNESQSIENVIGEDIVISDESVLDTIIEYCLNSKTSNGIVHGEGLRFYKFTNGITTKIAFVDRTNEIKTLSSLIRTSLFVGFFGMLAFFTISVFLANWALKPVEESWEQQKQFIADASHELKTPLTVILTNIGIIMSHKEDTVLSQSKWIGYVKSEAERMTTLINDMLFLAKADSEKSKLILSNLNFSDIVTGCLLTFESTIFERGKFLESDIQENIFINGEENKLKQLIMILLDNACKYSPEKSTIEIKLIQYQEKCKLTVLNRCYGISQEHLNHIFERFYRIEKSRSRYDGGYGLGLSIAQSIVNLNSGKIYAQSLDNNIVFTVVFKSVHREIQQT